ncbi:hypothetical protein H5410_040784, partial [Solanum commersonii]
FLKICAAKDHLAQLVGIVDSLCDLPFGLVHHLSSFAFNIFATLELWMMLQPFDYSPNSLGDPQAFISSFFQPPCSFFP